MCTGVEIAAAGLALSAATSAYTVVSTQQAKAASAETANQQISISNRENSRLQEEATKQAVAQKADRIRQADQQLGTLRAMQEYGGFSDTSYNAFVINTGYSEGVDLSRIEENRVNNITSLQAAKEAGTVGTMSQLNSANSRADGVTMASFADLGRSGLSFGKEGVKSDWKFNT